MTVWAVISGQFQHFPASKDILVFLKTSDMTIIFLFPAPGFKSKLAVLQDYSVIL